MHQRVLDEVYVWSRHNNVIESLGITTAFDHTISVVSPLMSQGNAFDYVQNPDIDSRPLVYSRKWAALPPSVSVRDRYTWR